ANRILRLPGSWETAGAVSGALEEMVAFDLPEDYWTRFPDEVRGLQLRGVREAAAELVRPNALAWIVVGDRATIEPKIRELGWGDPIAIDTDGNALK
ncbi:MAG: insulinase family protein, partial [Planctomycetota bacterium]|nr:insulinase family protein [Planctomycetota bacterium]